jgi:hypothetical protein
MTAANPHVLNCNFCPAFIDPADAPDAGWNPSYWASIDGIDVEVDAAVCPECAVRHLVLDGVTETWGTKPETDPEVSR